MKKTILITGASGFVGNNLLSKLSEEEEYEVIAVSRDEKNTLDWFKGKKIKKPFYEIDWNNDLSEIQKLDFLFHQAAIVDTSEENEEKLMYVNCDAPIDFFKKAIGKGVKKIIYASSTAVYGNSETPFIEGKGEKPLNLYGKTKLLLDKKAMKLAKENPQVIIVGLRYCNIYGLGDRKNENMLNMTYKLAKQILNEGPRLYNYGEQKRDQIYIKDVVKANICAMKNAKESCVLNCSSRKAISFNEMVKVLNLILEKNKKPIYIGPPPLTFQVNVECDMTKTKEKIGFITDYDYKKGVEDLFYKK